jgi:hypothetical protein
VPFIVFVLGAAAIILFPADGVAHPAERPSAVRVRYGYRRLHLLLRRGWAMKQKCVYRLNSEEGLSIRAKLPQRKRA